MMDMTVGELAQAVQGAVAHADGAQGVVTSVCTDSRQARQGSLFVAIRGERVDGHRREKHFTAALHVRHKRA